MVLLALQGEQGLAGLGHRLGREGEQGFPQRRFLGLVVLGPELICVDEMITDRFRLADAPKAFARAAERGAMKVLLT